MSVTFAVVFFPARTSTAVSAAGMWYEQQALTAPDMTSHSNHAIPGLFIKWVSAALIANPRSYEISPMKVIHKETRQSFAHFLTR